MVHREKSNGHDDARKVYGRLLRTTGAVAVHLLQNELASIRSCGGGARIAAATTGVNIRLEAGPLTESSPVFNVRYAAANLLMRSNARGLPGGVRSSSTFSENSLMAPGPALRIADRESQQLE